VLYRKYGCTLELGGDDQWANILAGADLIRRKEWGRSLRHDIHAAHNKRRQKMGKTEKGAVWLSAEKTSPMNFTNTGATSTIRTWKNVFRF
jgi:tyrosyl-tRNA synthetase